MHIKAASIETIPAAPQAAANEVNVLAHRIKNEIQALDEMNAAALRKKGQGMGSASERTRTSVTAGQHLVYLCVRQVWQNSTRLALQVPDMRMQHCATVVHTLIKLSAV